jgi:hypothetical protein
MARRVKKVHCWKCLKPLPIEKFHSIPNYVCPFCETHFSDKPKNESIFFQKQEAFLRLGSEEALAKMLVMIQTFSYNLICRRLKRSSLFLPEEDIEDKVSWCVAKMLSLYRSESKNFKITTSVVEYLDDVVLYPLYNYKDKERDVQEISLFEPIKQKGKGSQNGNKKEQLLIDKLSEEAYLDGVHDVENFMYKKEQEENVIDQIQDYMSLVIDKANETRNFNHALKMIILYKHYLNKKPPRFFNEWWVKEGFELRDHFEMSLTVLRQSLHEIRDY